MYPRRACASRRQLWHDGDMRNVLPRLLAALPDAITSGVFLTAWIAPEVAGPERIKNLLLTMLIEFIVVHSSGFYGGITAMDASRLKRALAMLGLGAFYMAFILAFSLTFGSTWPIWVFGWLLGSRFVHLWVAPVEDAAATTRTMQLWAVSIAADVLGAIATVILPLPELGITPEVIDSLHLEGSGEWIERPYTVLAFGALYFGIQAWAKYALSGSDAAARATVVKSTTSRRQSP